MTAEVTPNPIVPESLAALNDVLVWSLGACSLVVAVVVGLLFVFRGASREDQKIRQDAAVRASRASRAAEEQDAGQ